MTTTLTSDFVNDWQTWHSARERALATPHGWLSLTSFHWVPQAPSALPGLPGLFSVQDGHAVLTATADDGYTVVGDENGLAVPVDGTVRAEVAEARALQWVSIGDVQIELALRGGRYAIRTRDPQASALLGFAGVPTFDIDEKWVVTGHFEPFDAPRQIEVSTARDDLVQSITGVGTVTIVLQGQSVELTVTAGGAGSLNVPFHDGTNGETTARWRAVATTAPDADGRVTIDFNRAINFPFSFSDFGTCPAPPAGNVVPIAVTAGELAPATAA
ncbi:uncharacterized protein (DUF1684 family) [Nakamurella sp. UYEF19]|uniref:DUF1684 domain-containing protein n=1 Tax=Nakamurella sp. UYEF19 TaxID=1756392 RepID=UPI0033919997